MKINNDIQYLRAIAVVSVILFHTKSSIFPNGYLGVDLFFLISGYVVVPSLLQKIKPSHSIRSGVKAFYGKRFLRIVPAQMAMLLICTPLIFLMGNTNDLQGFSIQGIKTIFGIGNIHAVQNLGGYFVSNPNPITHTWSLAVEEQIYLFLPLILIAMLFLYQHISRALTLEIITYKSLMFIGITSFTLFAMGIENYYGTLSRIWEFSIGGLIAFKFKDRKFAKHRNSKTKITSFTLIAFLLSPYGNGNYHFGIIACIAISTVVISKGIWLPEYLKRSFQWIGDRSYSLYLWHLPLLYIAKYSPAFGQANLVSHAIETTMALFLLPFVAHFSYELIERRYTRASIERSTNNIKSIAIITTISLVSLTATAYASQGTIKFTQVPGMSGTYTKYSTELCRTSETINKDTPCIYNSAYKNRTLMVIGDSHGDVLAKSVIALGKKNKFRILIWSRAGCPFILNNNPSRNFSSLETGCFKHNQDISDYLSENKVELILSANRSMTTHYKDNFYGKNNLNELMNSLKILSKKVDLIYIVGPNPEFSKLPYSYLGNLFHKGQSRVEKRVMVNEYNSLKRLNSSRVRLIDSREIFCSGKYCTAQNKEGWLYSDDNHLSKKGASLYLQDIGKIMKIYISSETSTLGW